VDGPICGPQRTPSLPKHRQRKRDPTPWETFQPRSLKQWGVRSFRCCFLSKVVDLDDCIWRLESGESVRSEQVESKVIPSTFSSIHTDYCLVCSSLLHTMYSYSVSHTTDSLAFPFQQTSKKSKTSKIGFSVILPPTRTRWLPKLPMKANPFKVARWRVSTSKTH